MLVGRDGELRRLAEALGARRPVVVLGAAGIGKTALLRTAALTSGRRVFEGGGLASLSWRSYLAVGRAIGDPDLDGEPSTVATRIARRVGDGVLLLDDLHWADTDSLGLLPLLADRVAMLGAVRRADAGTEAAVQAVAGAGCETLDLGPLSDTAAAEVVRRRADLTDLDDISQILERGAGNPLLLAELSATGEASSHTLQYVLGARLRRCGEPARQSMARLGLLARPSPSRLLGPGVSELLDAGLVELRDDLVVPRHALLADAAVDDLSPGNRRDLHSRLAAELSAEPDDRPGEAARHHAAAGEVDRAREGALRAAGAATRIGERARHLQLAAAQGGDVRVRLDAASALVAVGDHDAADRLAAEIDDPDPVLRAEALLYRARAAPGIGEVARIREHVDAGLAIVGGTGTPIEVSLMVERAWGACGLEYDAERALPLAEAAHALATRCGVETERAAGVLRVARLASGATDVTRPGPEDAEDDPEGRCAADLAAVLGTFLSGDPATAEQIAEESITRCRKLLMPGWELQFRSAASMVALQRRGASVQYLSTHRTLLAEPLLPRMRAQIAARLAVVHADLGEVAEADALIDRLLPLAVEPTGRAHLYWARAEAAWSVGRAERAFGAADSAVGQNLGWHPMVALFTVVRAWARFEVDGGAVDPPPLPEFPAVAGATVELAALDLLRRADPGAAARFDEAASRWAGFDRRGELRCRWAAGEAARRAGDPAAAERLRFLERLCLDLGALGLLGRVRRSLRTAGVRSPNEPTGGRESSGQGLRGRGLSGREREVLSLVGAGLDSTAIAGRLGTARSTVDAQLRSAMRKLDARTRWEAAAAFEAGR